MEEIKLIGQTTFERPLITPMSTIKPNNNLKGPWANEPDIYLFSYRDRTSLIRRFMPLGYLCGYVHLKKEEELKDIKYFEDNIEVHGGITFMDYILNNNRFSEETRGPIERLVPDCTNKWIGFDCGHWGDFAPFHPIIPIEVFRLEQDVYRDLDFCIEETKRVIDQLETKE